MSAPLVLGFDTSAAHCAVALVRGETLLESTSEPMAKGQAERLMGLLDNILCRHGAGFQDLAALGVGVGPGNFTGIRIGVSAARGLALGLGIPACGINGFEQRQDIHPQRSLIAVPAPRDMLYVLQNGSASLMARDDAQRLGQAIPDDPAPEALAASIAALTVTRLSTEIGPPAPFYLRAPDAAPAKDAPPAILS